MGPQPGPCEDTGRKSADNFPEKKRTKKWTEWRLRTEEQDIDFQEKRDAYFGEDRIDENLADNTEKLLRLPLGRWRTTRKLIEKNIQCTPENVRLREEARATERLNVLFNLCTDLRGPQRLPGATIWNHVWVSKSAVGLVGRALFQSSLALPQG